MWSKMESMMADSDGRRNTPCRREVLCMWPKMDLIEKQSQFWVLISDPVGEHQRI